MAGTEKQEGKLEKGDETICWRYRHAASAQPYKQTSSVSLTGVPSPYHQFRFCFWNEIFSFSRKKERNQISFFLENV